jgi:membrane fusion protein (multidrug efflux system)
MRKQILTAVSAMIVVIAALGFVKYMQIAKAIAEGASRTMPPEAVTSAVAEEQVWPQTLTAVGSLAANQGVMLSSQEAGTVVKVNFDSGAAVKKGDVLIELDTSVEEANLESAKAKEQWTKESFDRAQKLRPQKVISDDALDSARAQYLQAAADVRSLRAVIERRKIAAPFDGRTGIRQVNVGQYVQAGTALVPLQSLDPLYVNFSLPQQSLNQTAVGQDVTFSVDAFPDTVFSAKLTTINPMVDVRTRNVEYQATAANPGEKLRPGMFAKVSLNLPEQDKVIVIPATSISYAPYGDTVYVIESMKDPAGKEFQGVRQQVVRLGETRGDLVAVASGLKAGETVVSSGLFKLRPGAAVVVDNNFQPSASTHPQPADK